MSVWRKPDRKGECGQTAGGRRQEQEAVNPLLLLSCLLLLPPALHPPLRSGCRIEKAGAASNAAPAVFVLRVRRAMYFTFLPRR